MAKVNSVPVILFSLLKRSGRNPLGAAAVVREIESIAPHLISRWGKGGFQKVEQYLGRRLEELADLGVVSGNSNSGYVLRFDQQVQDVEFPTAREGGGQPPSPPDDAPSGAGPLDEGSGIGVREILIHPTLFCVGEDDFDSLLEELLGNENGD